MAVCIESKPTCTICERPLVGLESGLCNHCRSRKTKPWSKEDNPLVYTGKPKRGFRPRKRKVEANNGPSTYEAMHPAGTDSRGRKRSR